MGDYARALTEGVVGNKQLVDELAEAIAEKMVVKMTTSHPQSEGISTNPERGQPRWAGSSVVECLPRTQEVRGSSPLQSTIFLQVFSFVLHNIIIGFFQSINRSFNPCFLGIKVQSSTVYYCTNSELHKLGCNFFVHQPHRYIYLCRNSSDNLL